MNRSISPLFFAVCAFVFFSAYAHDVKPSLDDDILNATKKLRQQIAAVQQALGIDKQQGVPVSQEAEKAQAIEEQKVTQKSEPVTPQTEPAAPKAEAPPSLGNDLFNAAKKLRLQIEETQKELGIEPRPITAEDSVRVILAPFQRTILSAQISTPILSSQVSAFVTKVYKRMGESFKKGEPLIEIDRTVFYANLVQQKAIVDRANTILDARQKLYRDQVASLTDLKEAVAAVATADAQLALAETQYDAALILAPYDGKIATLLIEEFELPQPGQSLLEIIQDDKLLAKALVPARLYFKLFIGKIIPVYVNETGKIIEAKIIRIGAMLDPSSETIAVEAEIDNSNHNVMAGMTGAARIR